VACSLHSGRFFDHDFSNQRDGYATSENTLVEKSYYTNYMENQDKAFITIMENQDKAFITIMENQDKAWRRK